MFENISEQYGQFIVMGIVFLVGALVYIGYLYYKKQRDIKNVNNNLQNINSSDKKQVPQQVPSKPPQKVPPKTPQKVPPKTNQQFPDFVPTETFEGEQKGYVFKKGDKGTGYYKENK
tara:strand:- start:48 stop:398 length:351 start_codon:yes stop_codon:yes gene_type:complete